MASFSFYLGGALLGHSMGKTAYTMPTVYMALFRATAGQSPRNTAVTVGQTTIPATPNGSMYKCTTAGTTGASEPTNWGGPNIANTDGTAVWTEMYYDFHNNSSGLTSVEASYTGYARVAVPAASWNAPGAGAITNAAAITFGQDTAGTNLIVAAGTYDALTAGNLLVFEVAGAATGVLNVTPNVTPAFAASTFSTSLT